MTHQSTKKFAIVDPRTFDGDPFEVADRAVKQIQGLIRLAHEAIPPARIMVRNAQLERDCQDDGQPDAAAWEAGAESRRWARLEETLQDIDRQMEGLARAASYNPKRPPTA